MATNVNDATFSQEILQSDVPVLVDFWAPWCGPCRAMTPVVDQLAEEYEGRAKVIKVNVDEAPQAASEYQIQSIPSFRLIVDGEVKGKLMGAVAKQQLEELIDEHVGAESACTTTGCGCSA